MGDEKLLPDHCLHQRAAELLNCSTQQIELDEVWSEEAEVWSVRDKTQPIDSEPIGWIKQHRTPQKARREQSSLSQWGTLLRGPTVLGYLTPNSLLLSHCSGTPLDLSVQPSMDFCTDFGHQLAQLHQHQSPATPDRLSLSDAMYMRIQTALTETPSTLKLPTTEITDFYLILREWLHKITELKLIPTTIERTPCHRDLRTDNLLIEALGNQAGWHISVIDWGQSRLDWWVSDWVVLWVEWCSHHQQRQVLWDAYWSSRPSSPHSDPSHELLIGLALRTLNTLRWAYRKSPFNNELEAYSEVWERAFTELNEVNLLLHRIK